MCPLSCLSSSGSTLSTKQRYQFEEFLYETSGWSFLKQICISFYHNILKPNQFILFHFHSIWLSPQARHVCPVYYVSTPHVKTSQISMKWSLEKTRADQRPVLPHTWMSGSVSFQPIRGEYEDMMTNENRVWRHDDQSEGRKCGQWREVRGEEAGKCRCLCGESIMFTDEEIWDIIWTYLEFITMLLYWDPIRG